ncbi:MAG: phosphatase PAP2 family protein, partial [Deltaproteobacteria bacterium]
VKRWGSFSCPRRETLKPSAIFALMAFLFLLPSLAGGQTWRFPSPSDLTLAQAQSASGVSAEEAPSLKGLPRAIAADQKPIWLFPIRAAEGHHWKPALAVTLATTGLVFLDSRDAPHFRRTDAFGGFNRAASGRNTMIGMAAVPLATLLAGWAGHNSYAENTALQAGEAAADSQLIALGMKFASRRLRPSDINPSGDFGHTWYKSNARLGFDSGFPSGHTITAFSIATVFAERYRRHRWVPWVAYGAATLVGFSRITLQSHFPSDVFAGAALGYSVSHFIVLRRQRGD